MNLKEQKKLDARKQLENIFDQLAVLSDSGSKFHKVAFSMFKQLLLLGKLLLQDYICIVTESVKSKGTPLNKFKNTGNKARHYRSIYGVLPINRPKYYSSADKVIYTLGAALGLPQNGYSYV